VRVRKLIAIAIAAAIGLTGIAACGPIKSTMAIVEVEKKLVEAEKLEASDKVASAYYYWAAREYLRKSKEEHGYSDFTASEEFANKSKELADKAIVKAKTGKKRVVEPDLDKADKSRDAKKNTKLFRD